MKPKDNKSHYDAGRLRHKVQFLQDVVTDDGYGGSVVSGTLVLSTFAGKEDVSQYTINGLNAGQTQYYTYQYFVIRKRASFTPKKDMSMFYLGKSYIVQTVKELDDPCTFLRLLCVASETPIPLDGLIYAGGSVTIPVTEADVKLLPYVFTSDSKSFTYSSGLNRIFNVAVPVNRVVKIEDLTSEEDITWLFTPALLMIDGVQYAVYTMENALPFTYNHIHKVTIV